MHPWTNSNTGHSRYIATGPTPDGSIENLIISVAYPPNQGMDLYKGINIDHHIVPLILRLPEMRETLRECADSVRELIERRAADGWSTDDYSALLARIDFIIRPTDEESEHGA